MHQDEDDLKADTAEEEETTGEIENVRVVVRVRPFDQNEIDSGSEIVVKVDKSNRCISVAKINSSSSSTVPEPPKRYYFDNVFGVESSQVCVCSLYYL